MIATLMLFSMSCLTPAHAAEVVTGGAEAPASAARPVVSADLRPALGCLNRLGPPLTKNINLTTTFSPSSRPDPEDETALFLGPSGSRSGVFTIGPKGGYFDVVPLTRPAAPYQPGYAVIVDGFEGGELDVRMFPDERKQMDGASIMPADEARRKKSGDQFTRIAKPPAGIPPRESQAAMESEILIRLATMPESVSRHRQYDRIKDYPTNGIEQQARDALCACLKVGSPKITEVVNQVMLKVNIKALESCSPGLVSAL